MIERPHRNAQARKRAREVNTVRGWDFERVASKEPVTVDSSQWEQVEQVWKYLQREERVVLQLAREGKTVSEIAVVMNLPGKQWARKELDRAATIVRYFVKWVEKFSELRACSDLSREQIKILTLYAIRRKTVLEISERLGKAERTVYQSVLKATSKLEEAGRTCLAEMVREGIEMQGLRGNRKRRATMPELWRVKLRDLLLSKVGEVWYVWGGQSLKNESLDCSGLVIEALKAVDVLPKDFMDMKASGLAKHFSTTVRNPKAGDLVFFGSSWQKVTHVMFYIGAMTVADKVGEMRTFKNCLVGMCGGRKNMSKPWAKMTGAALWIRTTPRYRSGFLGYRRVQ